MRLVLKLAVVLTLFCAACAPAAPSAAPTAAPPAPAAATPAGATAPNAAAASGKEILIGGTMALTGPASEPGKWFQRVYDWYFKELNARGGLLGRPVKLQLYDDESDPNKAAQLYDRLISVDKVDLLLAPYPTPTSAAVIPITERNGMVTVNGGTAASSLLKGRGNKYTFTVLTPLDTSQASTWTGWLMSLPEAQRPKSIAIFTLNNPFTLGIQTGLVADLPRLGMQAVVTGQ